MRLAYLWCVMFRILLTICTLMWVTGCSGSLDPAGSNQFYPDGPAIGPDAGPQPPPADLTPPPSDANPTADVNPTADSTPPNDSTPPPTDSAPPPPKDSAPPPPKDSAPPPPGGGKVGEACPCETDLFCVDDVCRATCTPPTDPCMAVANCPANRACIPIDTTVGVCLPAAKPGGSCDDAFCPVNYMCGSVNNSPYTCLPICNNPGGNCSNGSKCLTGMNGCTFCTSS